LLTVRRVGLTPAWPPTARLRKRRRGCSPQIRCCSLPPCRCATGCVAAAVADRVAGPRFKSPVKSRLLRSCGSTGRLRRCSVRSEPRCGPLFDTAKIERDRVKALGTTDDGGEDGLHNCFGALLAGRRSVAADARGTWQPSLVSHTDISDRHIPFVSRSMVGGLEVDLVLRLRRLRSVAGLGPGADLGPAKVPPAG
jgi:hypothetical protein